MSDIGQHVRTTKRYINILNQNGIHSIKDLLLYFPRAYEDRSKIHTLNHLIIDGKTIVATKGYITNKSIFNRNGKRVYTITFHDEQDNNGQITIFQSGYMAQKIQVNKWYIIIGKPNLIGNKITFTHPDTIPTQESNELQDQYNVGRIYPIYPELNGIKPGRFAQKIRQLSTQVDNIFIDYYPTDFKKNFNIPELTWSIKNIHYPVNANDLRKASYRIYFDKICKIQLYNQRQKSLYDNGKIEKQKETIDRKHVKDIIKYLPFTLTQAQKKVIKEIIQDFHEPKPMLRLLQGDVGSGKTVVATIAAYYSKKIFEGQTVFLAPLEILAQQHIQSIAKLVLPLGLRIALLTGSLSKSEKQKIKQDIANGKIDIIVGTHAILQDDITFHNLQFVVVDEQHKFGVKQRGFFKQFNSPHILQMSATPIPRSMALAFFGEFSISIIDELPAGRKPIHTKIVTATERKKLKPRILQKINDGQKVFIVAPLIQESDKLQDVQAATQAFEHMQDIFSEIKYQIGMLHGKIKTKEKETVMQHFKQGKIKILVSTTVIEVGVDIPEATIMVILNAERFGLSQLHQLRGRIGRSDLQSYCFLETPKKSGETYKRLKAMEQTNDGFKLAEIDLEQRGPGEVLGTKQSGVTDVPMEILMNVKFIEKAQKAAIRLLQHYPNLQGLDTLQNRVNEYGTEILA